MRFKRQDHPHPESELTSVRKVAELLGVSKTTLEKAVKSGRIDQFENAKGVAKFHQVITLQQFHQNKRTDKVSTPTRGQKAAGLDGLAAQAVAHQPMTNPGKSDQKRQAPTTNDSTGIDLEKRELAQSRAEKERFQARLTELKVLEKEGTLVDKQAFFQKAYTLASSIKDKLNGLPPQVTPSVIAQVETALIDVGGLPPEKVREAVAKSNLSHTVRESIRTGVVRALRQLTDKPLEEVIRD